MSDIPRIGPAPSAQEQMLRRQQEKALEELFQATCERAKGVMAQVIHNKTVIMNLNSVESETMLAGMAAAAIYAGQQFATSIVQQVGQHVEQLIKANNELTTRVAELEAKLGISK